MCPAFHSFAGLALSADGKKLAVADGAQTSPGLIYTSTNSGVTVTPTTSPAYRWTSIASSADGTKLVAAGLNLSTGGGVVYASTNSGTTWVSNGVAGSYSSWRVPPRRRMGRNWWWRHTPARFTRPPIQEQLGPRTPPLVLTGKVSPRRRTEPNWWRWKPAATIYTSTNSGATWASNNVPVAGWQSVASSRRWKQTGGHNFSMGICGRR